MQFNLLLTSQRRVRWLWWGLLAYGAGCAGLLVLGFPPSFWLLMAMPLTLLVVVAYYDKLFRLPGWVLVEADGLTWANPASDTPGSWRLAEIRTYRFEHYSNGIKLFLYLQDGQKIKLDASFSLEYAAMQKAFEQAVGRHNQACPTAKILVEKTFFERPISSKTLLVLLAASVVWVAWRSSQGGTATAYLPVLVIVLPYLAVWAAYSGRRE